MVNKTISLTEEMFNKVRGEENASALIDRLLRNHFKFDKLNLEEINNKINSSKELIVKNTETIESEIEKLERLKGKIESEEKERLDLEERYKTKEGKFRDNFLRNYKEITNKEATEEQFIKFKSEWDKGEKGFNIFKFIEEEDVK